MRLLPADRNCGGSLHQLTCLNPAPHDLMMTNSKLMRLLRSYGRYLAEECGYIQLDGMPADGDVGSRRLQLESLFVPLHLDINETVKAATVGAVLTDNPALLCSPRRAAENQLCLSALPSPMPIRPARAGHG